MSWLAVAQKTGAGVLPAAAERELMQASRVGEPDSLARRRAIDRAYTSTSRNYPQLFKD